MIGSPSVAAVQPVHLLRRRGVADQRGEQLDRGGLRGDEVVVEPDSAVLVLRVVARQDLAQRPPPVRVQPQPRIVGRRVGGVGDGDA